MPKKREEKHPPLTAADIKAGRLFRGKKPKEVLFRGLDDRSVLYVGGTNVEATVQYDSYAVAAGRKYPKTTMEKFLKWASHDVTEEEKAKAKKQ
jgi:hypothetical protein